MAGGSNGVALREIGSASSQDTPAKYEGKSQSTHDIPFIANRIGGKSTALAINTCRRYPQCMSSGPSHAAFPDSERWSVRSQFAAMSLIVFLLIGFIAFLGRDPPFEQATIRGPVKFSSSFLPNGEIELSKEASAGFARLISTGTDTIDRKLLQKAAPMGTFHANGRRFNWHDVDAFIVEVDSRNRLRVWHSPVLAKMSGSFYREPEANDKDERIRSAWDEDLSGFAEQP